MGLSFLKEIIIKNSVNWIGKQVCNHPVNLIDSDISVLWSSSIPPEEHFISEF